MASASQKSRKSRKTSSSQSQQEVSVHPAFDLPLYDPCTHLGPRPVGAVFSGEVAQYNNGKKIIITPARWVTP